MGEARHGEPKCLSILGYSLGKLFLKIAGKKGMTSKHVIHETLQVK